ncbi:MAG: ribonuclease HI family protein [Candidatus Pacebacteria bacterium]|jgi:ribonuclease HI|nr:ribonuclease HI family protein [Candidatus Paceibacterota bacterium]MDD3808301.1 ribonuclease HI family protein [Candidatus Paceibacterota bacterium]
MNIINVYTDGGSRNNPGNAGVGVVINDLKFKKYIGIKTNNEAEYEAVIFALEKLKENFELEELNNSKIIFHLDSELVCKQINREYKIKDEKLGKLFLKIYNLKFDLANIEFVHVRREFNKEADKLVNEALDEYEKGAK